MKKVVEILNKAIVETLKTKGITNEETNEVIELIAEARDRALNLPIVIVPKGTVCDNCGNDKFKYLTGNGKACTSCTKLLKQTAL